MNNILDFLPAQSMKPKGGGEWCGPCPICHGATTDGFVVWPDRPKGGAYLCRKCGGSGDGIQFLRTCHSLSYREACEELGLTPCDTGQSVTKCHQLRSIPKLPPPPLPAVTMPSKEWTQKATAFLHECQHNLEANPAAVLALAARGLTPATATACGLGWNGRDRYDLRSVWGLPPMQGKDKMVLPAGLVICTRRRSGPVALTIRTASPDRPKYWEVAGSGKNLPYVTGKQGVPVILLESALDAALLWQEAGDLCAALAFMGNMKGMDAATSSFISCASVAIGCPDNDDGGKTAWQRWAAAYPSAVCCPAAGAKDLTDMHISALSGAAVLMVRQWARSALTLAVNLTPTHHENHDYIKSDPTHTLNTKQTQRAA